MEPAKINSLTHKPASRADAGAAPLARAGASLAAVHLIESALNQDAGTGNAPPHAAPGSPHAHAHATLAESAPAPVSKPLAASGAMAPSPLPSATIEQEGGVRVALSTQAIAAAANPNTQDSGSTPLPAAQGFTPEVGAVAYPTAGQLPATPQSSSAAAVEEKSATPAIAQARDAERLAGLALKPEITAAPSQRAYDVLVLITVIIGTLLLIFL